MLTIPPDPEQPIPGAIPDTDPAPVPAQEPDVPVLPAEFAG